MELLSTEDILRKENEDLTNQVNEYKDLVDAIRHGTIDALVIYKEGAPDIFALESSDFVYRVLVENFAEGALNVNDRGVIVYANPAFESLLGLPQNAILGSEIVSLIDSADKRTFQKLFKNAFSGKSKGEVTLTYKERKVRVYVSLSSLYPRYPGIGIIITNLSDKIMHAEEITNYKNKLGVKEKELLQAEISQKSTEKFRIMADILPQKIWTANADGEIDYFNKKWLDYTQLSFDDLQGWGWKKSFHPEDWPKTEIAWKHSIESGLPFEFEHRLLKHDGTYNWFLSRGIPQVGKDNKVDVWVCTSTNIHDQKNSAQALEHRVNEATAFLRTVFNSTEELITSFDNDLKCTSINRVAARNTQDVSRNLVGKNLFEIYPRLDTSSYRAIIAKALQGEMIHERDVILIENNSGVFDTYFKPLIIDGDVSGVLITARDVSSIIKVANNLREAKEKLEEQFVSIKEKNNELTFANTELLSFTYVASHDLKEPLRKIQIFSRMILEKQGPEFSENTKENFNRIILAAKQMQNLIEALLSYSRINNSPSDLVITDLNSIVNEVKGELQDMITDKQAIIIQDELPTLNVIPFQISQLFSNLLSNCLKYAKSDLPCTIKIGAKIVAAENINSDTALSQANYWQISIEDNGIGFDQKYEFKIFELFQRLHSKDTFEGTGIGLAICNKIVQNHNGLITATGVPDVGSTFNIFLPVVKEPMAVS